MSYLTEYETLELDDLIKLFHGPNLEGESYVFYDELAVLIRAKGKPGKLFLLEQLKIVNREDGERLRALMLGLAYRTTHAKGSKGLTQRQKAFFQDQLIGYLDDQRPLILAEAIDGLCRLKVREIEDRICEMRKHSAYRVRRSVLNYLHSVNPVRAFPLLVEALQDEGEWVREDALDKLAFSEKPEIIPLIQPLLEDTDEHVRESAQFAIGLLEEEIHHREFLKSLET